MDPTWVNAISTSVYGAATLGLVIQVWRDRVQREEHSQREKDARKLDDLRRAFYEAWGYTVGHEITVGTAGLDPAQVSRKYESLARLECQLRLNGYDVEANNLGLVIMAENYKIRTQLRNVGKALGLMPEKYFSANTGVKVTVP
jgi:hypothetical protein